MRFNMLKCFRCFHLKQPEKFFMMAILVCDWFFYPSFSVSRFPLLSHDKYGIETIKTNVGNAGRWDEDRSWILYKLASVFFVSAFSWSPPFNSDALYFLSHKTPTHYSITPHTPINALYCTLISEGESLSVRLPVFGEPWFFWSR